MATQVDFYIDVDAGYGCVLLKKTIIERRQIYNYVTMESDMKTIYCRRTFYLTPCTYSPESMMRFICLR